MKSTLPLLASALLLTNSASAGTFSDDASFLKKHTDVVILKDATGQHEVAVSGGMEGRVMTSTATGDDGASYGWINRDLFELGKLQPHMNAFGGEDRFWIGPEGGQFSVFFARKPPSI